MKKIITSMFISMFVVCLCIVAIQYNSNINAREVNNNTNTIVEMTKERAFIKKMNAVSNLEVVTKGESKDKSQSDKAHSSVDTSRADDSNKDFVVSVKVVKPNEAVAKQGNPKKAETDKSETNKLDNQDKKDKEPVKKKEPTKEEPKKEEPQEEESIPEVPVVNVGNAVTFNRIIDGTQVYQLSERLQGYAEEIVFLVKNSKNTKEILDYDWTYEEWKTVKSAINNTYFRFTNGITLSYSSSPKPTYELEAIQYSRENFNKAQKIENYISNATQSCVWVGMSERDAVTAINNYVCNLITYNSGHGDIYDAFATGLGRCSSYASVVEAMCKYAGISCQYISGSARKSSGLVNHAWNRVLIGGTWYYIDACWNDDTNNVYMFSEVLWENHVI